MNRYIEPCCYVAITGYVYLYLIPSIGSTIQSKCYSDLYCSHLLHSHSLTGYPVDLSDNQYREFRSSIWLVVAAIIGSKCLQYVLRCMHSRFRSNILISECKLLTVYHALFGLTFLYIQHKWHAIIVLILIFVGFFITKLSIFTGKSEVLIWVYALSMMLLKEGHRFQWLRQIQVINALFDKNTYGGIYGWHLSANFLVLRIISFGVDSVRCQDKEAAKNYTCLNMLAYCTYAPLYIAGPIITFDEYMRYLKNPQSEENVGIYALRWMLVWGLMEGLCIRFPFFAVLKSGLFLNLSSAEIAVVSYMTLKMM